LDSTAQTATKLAIASNSKGNTKGPYDLELWKGKLPEHQIKVMESDIM
jgi:hypothetical protein